MLDGASLIGQGTWMLEQDPEPRGVQALRAGIDLGLTRIDTAEMYGTGRAEGVTGKAIHGLASPTKQAN